MDTSEFWLIVNKASSNDEPENIVERELTQLPAAKIIAYQKLLNSFCQQANRWDLWAAAYIIAGSCTDDSFIDFRYGLIALGQAVFEKAIANPDSLTELGEDVEVENELFAYVAQQVYEEKTGEVLPLALVDISIPPSGEPWDFDDEDENEKRLPGLMQMHW